MNSKAKLKTLPNEPTHESNKSSMKNVSKDVLSCASPTFALNDKLTYNDALSKENSHSNNSLLKKQEGTSKNSKLEMEFMMLKKKYDVCSKNLQGKLEKSVKKLYASHTCQNNEEAVNLILELKAMAEEVKNYKHENKAVKEQYEGLLEKYRHMEKQLIMKKKSQEESSMKVEAIKQKYEEKIRKLEKDKEEKEEKLRKKSQEYEKIHFLKNQIEKKRNEDIVVREELEQTIQKIKQQNQRISMEKNYLQEQNKKLEKSLKSLKNMKNQTENQLQQQLRVEKQSNESLKNQIQEYLVKKVKIMQEYEREKNELKNNNKEKYEKQLISLEENVKVAKQENQLLHLTIQQLKEEKDEIEQEKFSLQEELGKKSLSLRQISKEVDEFNQVLKIEQEKTLTLEEQLKMRNQELLDSMRKIQELQQTKEKKNWDTSKQKIPTKTIFQLRMATSIISQILDIENVQYSGISREENEVEYLVNKITELSEQVADYYDELNEKIDDLCSQIEKKEDMIATVLKFSPEEKRNSILNYLNVMESKHKEDQKKVQQIISQIQLEAQNWKSKLQALMKAEEGLKVLKRELKQKEEFKKPELPEERGYWKKEESRLMRREGVKRKYMQQS